MPNSDRLRLQDICTIQMGYTARRQLAPIVRGGIAAIRLQDVHPGGHIDPSQLVRVRADQLSDRHLVCAGDVVFRSRSDHNTAAALGDRFSEPALALLPLFILRPKPRIILPAFLAWSINQGAAQRHFERVGRGTNMRMISRSGLSSLEVDVPDIGTQRRIVAVDDLASRERALSLHVANRRRTRTTLILNDLAKVSSTNKRPRPRHSYLKRFRGREDQREQQDALLPGTQRQKDE